MENLKMKFDNTEDCAKAQQIILDNGITWRDGNTEVHKAEKWLVIVHEGYLFTDGIEEEKEVNDKEFNEYPGKAITLEELEKMDKPLLIKQVQEDMPNIRVYPGKEVWFTNHKLNSKVFLEIAELIK